MTLAELVKHMHASHVELLGALGSPPGLEAGWIAADTYAHYLQHAAQVRAWRSWQGL